MQEYKETMNKRDIYIYKMMFTSVDTHFRDTFSTSPIQPNSTSLWTRFMYYILFYSFKHDPSPCNLWGN